MFIALTRATNGQLILINLRTVTHIRALPVSHGEGEFTQIGFAGGDFANVRESIGEIQARIAERESVPRA